jgi:succinyl-CoA synthetase alpha subunit
MTLFDTPTVLVQGITGRHGAFHTKSMLDAGTNIVAGVTPGKASETVHGTPVYGSVGDACIAHPSLDTSVVFVPAAFAKSAVIEAIDAGIQQVIVITEGIPVHDALTMHEYATGHNVTLVGPNCPGLIVPGNHKLGIIAAHITSPGSTAIISRSGTLTYELADALTKAGIGQSIILGIGGDPVPGMNFVDALKLVEANPSTEQIIMVGEIGGTSEQLAADYVAEHVTKPVYGLVVGHSAPAGQTFGHAGAIVGSDNESAHAKTTYLRERGITAANTLSELIETIKNTADA